MVAYQGTDVDGVDDIPAWITLDAPQLFRGPGQISLLGDSCETLYFKNDGVTTAANISVIAVRSAELFGG
jgi:hypothetical protein